MTARRRHQPHHSPEELAARAKTVAVTWAKLSNRPVAIRDAEKVARLDLTLPALLTVLEATWATKTGIGLAWVGLRAAVKAKAGPELTFGARTRPPHLPGRSASLILHSTHSRPLATELPGQPALKT